MFAYIIVSLSLLIIAGLGLVTGIFLLDKFDKEARDKFYDQFLGSFKIIFTIHDFMFATVILGIFYFLALKAKNIQSISKRGGILCQLDSSGNDSGKNLGTREIQDILNNPTERNNYLLEESERMNSQTAVLLEEDSEKPKKSTFKALLIGGRQRLRKNTYQLNQEDTLEETEEREEMPSEGGVDTENSGRERVTFHKYWLNQIIAAGIKPQDSI